MYPFTFQISLVFALFTSFRPALIFGVVDFGCSLDNSFDFQANYNSNKHFVSCGVLSFSGLLEKKVQTLSAVTISTRAEGSHRNLSLL